MGRLSIGASLLLCAACSQMPLPLARSRPARERGLEGTLRIECHYAMTNCERKARDACNGPYDETKRGESICTDCGNLLSDTAQPVWVGTLYVRCR